MIRGVAVAIAAMVLAWPAQAGRPLTTEDAAVLDDRRCQLEAWIDKGRGLATGWLVPACNFGAGIEWQAGFARTRAGGASRFSEAYAQAKAAFGNIERDRWSWGLVGGLARFPQREARRGWSDPYAIAPVSLAAGGGMVHMNLGVRRDRAERRNATLWGAALEMPASERLTLVAEGFGQDSERPFLRAGGRLTVVKDVVDLDFTLVTRPGGTREERFVSLGVFFQTGRILP